MADHMYYKKHLNITAVSLSGKIDSVTRGSSMTERAELQRLWLDVQMKADNYHILRHLPLGTNIGKATSKMKTFPVFDLTKNTVLEQAPVDAIK